MRKYFYLVTEHEDEDRTGGVSVHDSPMSRPTKNEEGAITVLDEDEEGFQEIGKKVGLGYHDFEDEDEYNDNELLADVMQAKIRSVDREWARKAGVEGVAYDD